ncbi:MAG: T9SS type A sorting domain-containing protein [Marinilabiliaceae bacterium]|nr:T9SS type A sorting domain-containing protein [Marinilabiliaceae bacterium]
MRKKLFFTICISFALLSLYGQRSGGTIHDLGSGVYLMGVSPNGQYVTGYILMQNSILWTDDDGLVHLEPGGNSQAYAVSDNGVVVGQFYDFSIMYEEYDGELYPLFSAGYYQDDQWNSLGIKPELEFIDGMSGSLAEAISADGTKIGGSMYIPGWRLEPTIWTNAVPTGLEFEAIGQGARLQGMSADGTVACGWAAPFSTRMPVVWVDGELIKITNNGMWLEGEAFNVSPNGKLVALKFDNKAAIYDVENEQLTIIGAKNSVWGASATAVSDNGVVVGYNQLGLGLNREGFIYTKQLGMRDFNEYLVEVGIAEAATADLACPISISADGKRIVGFGSAVNGWIVDIDEHLTAPNPPSNLSIEENGFGNIILTWEEPDPIESAVEPQYNIYRNDIKINSELITDTSYSDILTLNGQYSYKVTAVWFENDESIPTNTISVNLGKVELPFLEDFDSGNFSDNYWNISPDSDTRWNVSSWTGINPPAIYYTAPTGTTYSEFFVSPYINALDSEELKLSFNFAPASNYGVLSNETFIIEIFDGTFWNIVEEYMPVTYYPSFEYKEFDISDIAAGKEIRVRFRVSGDNKGDYLNWTIDNINVFEPNDALILSVPLRVTAFTFDDETIHVNWADPGDVATLSYLQYNDRVGWIGNEGVPFIAAAKFDANDLIGYNGYKMVSITAHLTNALENNQPEYKLAVFIGDERIVDQPIDNYIPNDWNTFELDEPIVISRQMDQPLYFGIEVVSHNNDDFPITLCERPLNWETMEYEFGGRSNLYSEDGGQTWGVLSEFDIQNSVAVKANLVSHDGAKPKERLMGYKLFRNDENLLGQDWSGNDYLTVLNNYTDNEPLESDDVCYQVLAYYNVQQESEKTQFCLGDEIRIEAVSAQDDRFAVFPNPVDDFITIEGENFAKAELFDMKGTIIISTDKNKISLKNLPKGIYLLKIETIDGDFVAKKIIKN